MGVAKRLAAAVARLKQLKQSTLYVSMYDIYVCK